MATAVPNTLQVSSTLCFPLIRNSRRDFGRGSNPVAAVGPSASIPSVIDLIAQALSS